MSRHLHLTVTLGFAALLLLGGLMWQRWGTLVWLDAAIAFCL